MRRAGGRRRRLSSAKSQRYRHSCMDKSQCNDFFLGDKMIPVPNNHGHNLSVTKAQHSETLVRSFHFKFKVMNVNIIICTLGKLYYLCTIIYIPHKLSCKAGSNQSAEMSCVIPHKHAPFQLTEYLDRLNHVPTSKIRRQYW